MHHHEPRENPFHILVDDREKAPWHFTGLDSRLLRKRKDESSAAVWVPTSKMRMETGDYSIPGHSAGGITIERKSLDDARSTLIHGRERFHRELERMTLFNRAVIIIESDWPGLTMEDPNSGITGAAIQGTMESMMNKYQTITWLTAGNRRLAERLCFRILEYYWRRNG